jgi:protein-S-isoprenylcysteine O-methyltransferase Ste14
MGIAFSVEFCYAFAKKHRALAWGHGEMPASKTLNPRRLFIYGLAVILVVFARPTAFSLGLGLVIISLGEALRFWAAGHLRKNDVLTTTGPYAYVKHPLYIGTMLITMGFCIMADNIYILAVGLLAFSFYYLPYKNKVEDERMKKLFGEAYLDYAEKVPDYIPRLSPYERSRGKWRWRTFVENSEEGIVALEAIGVFLIGMRLWI